MEIIKQEELRKKRQNNGIFNLYLFQSKHLNDHNGARQHGNYSKHHMWKRLHHFKTEIPDSTPVSKSC